MWTGDVERSFACYLTSCHIYVEIWDPCAVNVWLIMPDRLSAKPREISDPSVLACESSAFGIQENNGSYLLLGFRLIIFYAGISFRYIGRFDLFTDPYLFMSMWCAIVLGDTYVRHRKIRDDVAKSSYPDVVVLFILLNVK